MTWVRLDDEAMQHPKLLRAGPEAVCLWLAGLCHCNRYFTDGRIEKAFVVGLYPPVATRWRRVCARLVDQGLWRDLGDHIEVHDYAIYQAEALKEYAAEKERDREAKKRASRERQRKSRANRDAGAAVDTETSRVTEPVTKGNGHASPEPEVTRDVTRARDHARPCAHAPVSRPVPARPSEDQDLGGSSRSGVVVALLDRGGHKPPPPPPLSEKSYQRLPADASPTCDALFCAENTGLPKATAPELEVAPNGDARLTGRDVANLWHRVMAMPNAGIAGASHPISNKRWREAYETIACACNGVQGKPVLALQVVCEWFWLAPDGPVQAGRVTRATATPEVFAAGILRDLEGALTWWAERKQQPQEQHA